MAVIYYLLLIYMIIMLVRVFSSWIRIPSSGPIATGMSFVYAVTEPVLRPLRNLLPPLRMGALALDLSPIIVFIVLSILLGYFHP